MAHMIFAVLVGPTCIENVSSIHHVACHCRLERALRSEAQLLQVDASVAGPVFQTEILCGDPLIGKAWQC